MTVNPSDYDLIQDGRLDSIESLISAEYEPPAGSQYSYPVASQGITQDQWQQMMLSMGDGAIVTEDSEHFFRLVKHDTDAETNQRNTLIMKVAQNTGRNEASLAGFYFRQTEDIELPFPAVTTTTVYHVTVTYDPRKFKTEPLRLEVWAGEPPRAHGQRHLVLRTVPREANQLLSQAPISTLRHYVSPVITAVTEAGLPDSKDVLYGTLGIVRSRTSGGTVVPGTGTILEARGSHGWYNLLIGEWNNFTIMFGGWTESWGKWRRRNGGIDVVCRMNHDGSRNNPNRPFALPSTLIKLTIRGLPFWATDPASKGVTLAIDTDGHARFSHNYESKGVWFEANFFIPDYYL